MPNRYKQERGSDPMRCPTCGSRHTQSLPTAYAYSAHVFREGLNPDAMAGALEPPRRRSEVAMPTIAGTVIFTLTHVAGVVAGFELGIFGEDFGGIYDKRVIVPAALVGFASAVATIWRAVRWNTGEYRLRLEEWRSTAICRRCSSQFRPPEMSSSAETRE